jgi:hypothetical protein
MMVARVRPHAVANTLGQACNVGTSREARSPDV